MENLKEAYQRCKAGEKTSAVAQELGVDRNVLAALVKYADAVCMQAGDTACNDCMQKIELHAKVDDLSAQLRAIEVERNCANCQNVRELTKQVDDLTHLQMAAPSCDSCARIAALEKELTEERETIHAPADCSTCDKAAELSRALLDNADLRQRIEEMQTFPASAAPAVQDCSTCDRIAEVVTERDAAKSKLQGIEEKYQGLEKQYRQSSSEAAKLRVESEEIKKERDDYRGKAGKYDSLVEQYNALQTRFREHREKYQLTDRAFLALMAGLFGVCLGLTLVAAARLLLR